MGKHQHYVPQFLLRRFSIRGEEKQVWCFRKADSRAFEDSIARAGGESWWNQYVLPNDESLEQALERVEHAASGALKRVVATERTNILKRPERELIALFVALQLLRTPGFRDMLRQFDSKLSGLLGEAGRRRMSFDPLDKDGLRDEHCKMIASLPGEIIPALVGKHWVLQKADGEERFVIGDSPVVLRHMHGDMGDRQWVPSPGTRGAEVYLPLTPRLTLAMWCRSLPEFDAWRRDLAMQTGRLAPAPAVPRAALRGERPHLIGSGTVGHLNFMQLQFAYRHVYADRGNFDDLREMIGRDERLTRAPELHIDWEAAIPSLVGAPRPGAA